MSTVMPPALLSEDVLALMVNCQDMPDRDTVAFSKMKSVFSPDKLSRCPPSPATVFPRGGIGAWEGKEVEKTAGWCRSDLG